MVESRPFVLHFFLSTADSPFLAQVHFPLEYPPGALRVDDFNVDGLPDVAVVHGEAGRLSVLLSLPATADLLGPPTTYEVGRSPVDVRSGDLNGDGAPDLFVVNIGSSTVNVLLNRGDGSFLSAREFSVGSEPRVGELADFNGDGVLDAITTNFRSADLSVLFSDGQGGFSDSSRLHVGDNPHCIA